MYLWTRKKQKHERILFPVGVREAHNSRRSIINLECVTALIREFKPLIRNELPAPLEATQRGAGRVLRFTSHVTFSYLPLSMAATSCAYVSHPFLRISLKWEEGVAFPGVMAGFLSKILCCLSMFSFHFIFCPALQTCNWTSFFYYYYLSILAEPIILLNDRKSPTYLVFMIDFLSEDWEIEILRHLAADRMLRSLD